MAKHSRRNEYRPKERERERDVSTLLIMSALSWKKKNSLVLQFRQSSFYDVIFGCKVKKERERKKKDEIGTTLNIIIFGQFSLAGFTCCRLSL